MNGTDGGFIVKVQKLELSLFRSLALSHTLSHTLTLSHTVYIYTVHEVTDVQLRRRSPTADITKDGRRVTTSSDLG